MNTPAGGRLRWQGEQPTWSRRWEAPLLVVGHKLRDALRAIRRGEVYNPGVDSKDPGLHLAAVVVDEFLAPPDHAGIFLRTIQLQGSQHRALGVSVLAAAPAQADGSPNVRAATPLFVTYRRGYRGASWDTQPQVIGGLTLLDLEGQPTLALRYFDPTCGRYRRVMIRQLDDAAALDRQSHHNCDRWQTIAAAGLLAEAYRRADAQSTVYMIATGNPEIWDLTHAGEVQVPEMLLPLAGRLRELRDTDRLSACALPARSPIRSHVVGADLLAMLAPTADDGRAEWPAADVAFRQRTHARLQREFMALLAPESPRVLGRMALMGRLQSERSPTERTRLYVQHVGTYAAHHARPGGLFDSADRLEALTQRELVPANRTGR